MVMCGTWRMAGLLFLKFDNFLLASDVSVGGNHAFLYQFCLIVATVILLGVPVAMPNLLGLTFHGM